MTWTYAALAVGLVAMAAVAAVAMVRARRAETALRAAAEEHWRTGDDRSAPVETQHARVARTSDAHALEDIRRTAGDLAHDLNDSLTVITGRTELLLTSLDEAHPGRSDANEILRVALNAGRITKLLRSLSGSGAVTEVIDVNTVLSRTTEGFTVLLGSDIVMSLALDPLPLRVRVGASHVEEIVLNLAMRARAAMPRGGRITISTARHAPREHDVVGPARDYVRILVADTGVGMDEAERKTLFERLLVRPGIDSVAVGLAKVCDIVKQAGGVIQVESAPGLGTTFTVDLPETMEPVSNQGPSSSVRTTAASVLVVDDEPRIRELIKVVLSRAGHDVVAVRGPHEGLAVLKRQPTIELMLVDVVMPEMSGYDLAIQARKLVPGLQMVFMSGFARDLRRHPPGDMFIAKPFAVEALHDVVQQALSGVAPASTAVPAM